jgi:hypothetical protein
MGRAPAAMGADAAHKTAHRRLNRLRMLVRWKGCRTSRDRIKKVVFVERNERNAFA